MNDRGNKQIQKRGNGCLNPDSEEYMERRQKNRQTGCEGDERTGVNFKVLTLETREIDLGVWRGRGDNMHSLKHCKLSI